MTKCLSENTIINGQVKPYFCIPLSSVPGYVSTMKQNNTKYIKAQSNEPPRNHFGVPYRFRKSE